MQGTFRSQEWHIRVLNGWYGIKGVEIARPLELVASGFESWLCHLFAVCGYGKMIALSLSFPVCEMGMTVASTSFDKVM